MQNVLTWIAARLKEPSTWAGLGSVVTGLGFAIAPDLWKEISAVGLGLGGLLAVLVREKA